MIATASLGWQLHLLRRSDLVDGLPTANYGMADLNTPITNTDINIQTTWNLVDPSDMEAYPQSIYDGGKCMLAYQPNAINCTAGLSGPQSGVECKMKVITAHLFGIEQAVTECGFLTKASGAKPYPPGGAQPDSACGKWAALASELTGDFTAALKNVIHFVETFDFSDLMSAYNNIKNFFENLASGVLQHPSIQCLQTKVEALLSPILQEDLLWVGYNKMDPQNNGQAFAYYIGCDGELLSRVGHPSLVSDRRRRKLEEWRRLEEGQGADASSTSTDSGGEGNGGGGGDTGGSDGDGGGDQGDSSPPPSPPAIPLASGTGQMQLSRWATGFTFLLNTFLEPVAAISRCNGQAENKATPCTMEFHKYNYDYTPNNQYMGCRNEDGSNMTAEEAMTMCTSITLDFGNSGKDASLAVAIKVPSGISNIAYDAGVTERQGMYTDGQYLTVSFTGMTTEHVAGTNLGTGDGAPQIPDPLGIPLDKAVGAIPVPKQVSALSSLLASPEDRIHVLMAPILQTRAAESRDTLQAKLLGKNLFTPKEINVRPGQRSWVQKGWRTRPHYKGKRFLKWKAQTNPACGFATAAPAGDNVRRHARLQGTRFLLVSTDGAHHLQATASGAR